LFPKNCSSILEEVVFNKIYWKIHLSLVVLTYYPHLFL
jgi:hypothetical protein